MKEKALPKKILIMENVVSLRSKVMKITMK